MNNSDSEDLLKRREIAAQQAAHIEFLRNAVESNKYTKGLVHQDTLESMIILGDALATHSTNWPEELKTLSASERNQRDGKLGKERKNLYEFALNNSLDLGFKIKTKQRLAKFDSDSPQSYRDLIQESTRYFGQQSNETFDIVKDFVDSGDYETKDLELLYAFFKMIKGKNGVSDLNLTELADEYQENGRLDIALEMYLDILHQRRQSEPLWFIYEHTTAIYDVCDLYIKLDQYENLLSLLESLIRSYLELPAAEKEFREIKDLDDTHALLNSALEEIHSILDKKIQEDPVHLRGRISNIIFKILL